MDVGHITLMGSPEQQTVEARWRHKVSQLRQAVETTDVPAALAIGLGRYYAFEVKDRRLIEAALDGVSQASIADFIYLLMWRIQSEAPDKVRDEVE